MTMIWADPEARARHGNKRHAYRKGRATVQDADNGGEEAIRRCGTADTYHHPVETTGNLVRIDARDYAVLPNACLACVRAMDLDSYRERHGQRGKGADRVDYDPFGVFDQ